MNSQDPVLLTEETPKPEKRGTLLIRLVGIEIILLLVGALMVGGVLPHKLNVEKSYPIFEASGKPTEIISMESALKKIEDGEITEVALNPNDGNLYLKPSWATDSHYQVKVDEKIDDPAAYLENQGVSATQMSNLSVRTQSRSGLTVGPARIHIRGNLLAPLAQLMFPIFIGILLVWQERRKNLNPPYLNTATR